MQESNRRRVLWSCLVVVLVSHVMGEGAWGQDREKAIARQAELWRGMSEKFRKERDEAVPAIEEMLALEKTHFGTHSRVYFVLAHALEIATQGGKLEAANRRARIEAAILAARWLRSDPMRADTDGKKRLAAWTEAAALRSKWLGERHPLTLLTRLDLARAELSAGDAGNAFKRLEELADVAEKIGKDESLRFGLIEATVADCLSEAPHLLARRALRAGRLDEAKTLLEQARRRSYHTQAPIRCSLADLYEAQGDFKKAATELRGVLSNVQGQVGNSFYGLRESLQSEQARGVRFVLNRVLSLARRHEHSPYEIGQIYFSLSAAKGGIFTHQRRIRLERMHPMLAPLFAEYQKVTARLAELQGLEDTAKETAKLQTRKEGLEAELSLRHERLPKYLNMTPAYQLPADAALLDFYVYDDVPPVRERDGKPGERRLACFVSLPKQRERLVDLGPLAPIEKAIVSWREEIQARRGGLRGFLPDKAKSPKSAFPQRLLKERVWDPLAPHLAKAETVLISPDGVLAFLPFATLPGQKEGKYLLEEKAIAVAPIPRSLQPYRSLTRTMIVRKADNAEPKRAGILLVGGVDFEKGDKAEAKAAVGARSLPDDLRFASLPGTGKEIDAIAALYRKRMPDEPVKMLTGAQATKETLVGLTSDYRWLHLATHGFYLPVDRKGEDSAAEVRSALALAGVNGKTGAGLLTALEVAALDLDGVELAALSACQTGLGDTLEGEGILGLQRAFLVAGVKSTLTSLWSVDDESTQTLMVDFYRNLWEKKMPRAEALRAAQIALLEGKSWRPAGLDAKESVPPFYWAAFGVAGEWR